MSALDALGFALGSAFASGLNLYATVATAGLLHHLGVIALPPGLGVLGDPAVWALAMALFALEFVADKIPLVDSAWDAVHTFVRPPAAALLAWAAVGDVPETWRIAAALLAGGVALSAHGAKATARAAVNTSPEPFSNWILSLGEDAIAIGLVWLAAAHPLVTAALVAVLVAACLVLVRALWRGAGRLARRMRSPRAPSPVA